MELLECVGFLLPGEFRNVPLIFGAALANERQERAGHCAFTILEEKRISDWSDESAISLAFSELTNNMRVFLIIKKFIDHYKKLYA